MSDNINTSMNFMPEMVKTRAPAVARAPRKELALDVLSSILSFLPQKDLARVTKASGSMAFVKAAVQSTTSKKVVFKKSVQKMINVLKAAGAEKQADQLGQLISRPIFRNPDIMFSDATRKALNKAVLIILSTLENPILFTLKANHMDMLKDLGLSTKADFVEMLIRGTDQEEAYFAADALSNDRPFPRPEEAYWDYTQPSVRDRAKSRACEEAARAFLADKDYYAALECADGSNLRSKCVVLKNILVALIAEDFTLETVLACINSYESKYIRRAGMKLLLRSLAEKGNYTRAITVLNSSGIYSCDMAFSVDKDEYLDIIFDSMKTRGGVSSERIVKYIETAASNIDSIDWLRTEYLPQKFRFKDYAQRMIAALKEAGAQIQADQLRQLISRPVFSDFDTRFSNAMKKELSKEALTLFSTLEDPILLMLKANPRINLCYVNLTRPEFF